MKRFVYNPADNGIMIKDDDYIDKMEYINDEYLPEMYSEDEDDIRHIKFLEDSQSRIHKIENQISLLKKLSDVRKYAYTPTEVDKMFDYLYDRIKEIKDDFYTSEEKFSW